MLQVLRPRGRVKLPHAAVRGTLPKQREWVASGLHATLDFAPLLPTPLYQGHQKLSNPSHKTSDCYGSRPDEIICGAPRLKSIKRSHMLVEPNFLTLLFLMLAL